MFNQLFIHWPRTLGFTVALCLASASFGAEKQGKNASAFQHGPGTASFKQTAQITLPEGYRFADGPTTVRLLRAAGEPTSGREMGMITPEEGGWSVFFEFSEEGYIKDDDKDKLNPDKLLKSIIKGNDYANEERKRMGNSPLRIIGWEQKPAYDSVTHNLEWAIRAESEGRPILNYNTRLLGRKGVMEVILVCDPEKLSTTLPTFKELLGGYSFKSGESYAEYRPGDKVAKYGLAALITGGAVAVAAKTGLLAALVLFLKKGWKLVIVAVVAIGAFIKRIFTGQSSDS